MASTTAELSVFDVKVVGPGTTVDFLAAKAKVTMVMVLAGTVKGGLVAMEASQDNTNWVMVHVLDAGVAANQYRDNVDGAFRYWRTNVLSTITGGGSVTTTFMEAG